MKYDSLLLNCGGGITNPAAKSKQFSQSAALCIGIGGTGVAALSDLKGKIYQQLEPDNPDEAVPRYDAIQLLGIDSDETAYLKYSGNRRLSRNEFFSIKKDNLNDFFQQAHGKQLIKDDPMMNWMEIDEINEMLSPQGAGGVRQMGRFMLLSRASALFTEIQNKCRLALQKREGNSLDIYIFAGISGGTGSGCFLDTCYLVRKVVEANGWKASIMGYFFLPDVVTSKPEVASQPASVSYNNSNGYAAMKELDYLMHLKENGDWFEQNYGAGITLRTQLAPVDMCHLISAQRADGSMVPNGFNYGINVASDYAMAYLAEVDLRGENADESSLTIRGHLANVTRGVQGIPRRWGANLTYHILGASNAEIPMTQINTYLAAGFFQKFARSAKVPRKLVTKDAVQKLMEQLRFQAGQVFESVVSGSEDLVLPDLDRKMLAGQPVVTEGKLPRTWGDCHNQWWAQCDGIMTTNMVALNKKLDTFGYDDINTQSLIGRLFRKLWDMSMDPDYGPYYAAYVLSNNGEDLIAALSGEIDRADGMETADHIQLPHMRKWIVQLNQDLVDHRGGRKYYDRFKDGVLQLSAREMSVERCRRTASVLRDLRSQVEELYNNFFRPLTEMLDNLQETFAENVNYLGTPEAKQANAYTWQILSLDDIRPRLDAAVEELNATQLVTNFIQNLLKDSSAWIKNDQDKIAQQISGYMLLLFASETNRSLQDYLVDKYPKAKGNNAALISEIQNDILKRIHDSAIPMFWCDATYNIGDPNYTFESSSLSVPNTCSAICTAADEFAKGHTNYAVRKTGIGDRIFALRFVSGIPLFAYQGITKLKSDYDAAGGKAAGAGSHLYSNTGRGKSLTDWRSYIPTPMPYSRNVGMDMHPEGKYWAEVYHDAVDRGIIGPAPQGSVFDQEEANAQAAGGTKNQAYAIFITPELEVRDYTVQDFMDGDVFAEAKFEAELKKIDNKIATLHVFGTNPECTVMRLKNDGHDELCKDKEAVRIDYFVQYTVMHGIVLKEISKDKRLKAAKAQLEAIHAEYFSYEKDLKDFADLLFHGKLECRDVTDAVNYAKTVSVLCQYKDRYGENRECYLVQNDDKFALHDAFEVYRQQAGGNVDAWDTLQDALNGFKSAKIKLEDTYVAAILEQIWDNRAMDKLASDKLKGKSDEVRASVLRFYNGLRANIRSLKDKMPQWPIGRSVEDLTAAVTGTGAAASTASAAPAAPVFQQPVEAPLPEMIYVYFNGANLECWTKQYRNYAYNRATGEWVQLNNQMYVARNGQWEPIKLDPNGNIIY